MTLSVLFSPVQVFNHRYYVITYRKKQVRSNWWVKLVPTGDWAIKNDALITQLS